MNSIILAVLLICPSLDQESIYDRVARASVEVLVNGRLQGSGWFADADGHIATAAHMVWRAKGKLEVRSAERGRLEVKLVAIDRGHDLALLQAPKTDDPYPSLPLRRAMPAPPAEIYLFGAPQFRHGLLLTGKVARKAPAFEYFADQQCAVRVFHVTGASPKGTSGGCWVDAEGNVVGLQSGMMTQGQAASGIAFVAPPDALRRLVETRQSATTLDAGLAVEELWEQNPKVLKQFPSGIRGLQAAVCLENGPAAKAGLPAGALIALVDGKCLETRDAFYRSLRSRKAGKSLTLDFIRPGRKETERISFALTALEDATK